MSKLSKDVYDIEGIRWLRIARAAQLLRTNALGVRTLMGAGKLDWRQTRPNSRTFVVSEADVMKLRDELPPAPPKKKKREKVKEFEPVRRPRGHAWTAHHLRLTLPQHPSEDGGDRKKDSLL